MANQMYRVMLAGPSLLYAPLYLAKIERLSYVYKWINFSYPTRRDVSDQDKGRHDQVYYKLLSPDDDYDVVLAVADPFRLRYKNIIGYEPSTAVVVGGLIQKMCLWLVSSNRFDLENGRYKDHFNQIVVHRKDMTSYALMRSLLKAQCVSDADIDALLFCNARLGEENLWATAHMRPRCTGKPFAYITGDRNHAVERYLSRHFTAAFFQHSQYKHIFFTGLVTSRLHYESNIGRQIVDELVGGVIKAIEVIYDDPAWAAKCLFRDAELCKRLPGEHTERQIMEYLRTLTAIEAYVKEPYLKVSEAAFNNGLLMHEAAQEPNPSAGILAKTDLCPAFTNVIIATGSASPSPRTPSYYAEPSEPGEQPSSKLFTWTGIILALLVSLFSLVRVAATGNSSPTVNRLFKPLADWLAPYMLVGENACKPLNLDWGIDAWLATILSVVALSCMLKALVEILEGTSEKSFFSNSCILFACILSMMTLTYTLADWSTTVGALSNWAVFGFAFYKFARRYRASHLTLPERGYAQVASDWFNRVCYAATERKKGKNLSEPLRIAELWKILCKCKS